MTWFLGPLTADPFEDFWTLTRKAELWAGELVPKAVWRGTCEKQKGQRPLENYNLSQEIIVRRTQVAS